MNTDNSISPSRIMPWLTLISTLFGILGTIWVVVKWFSPIDKIDLTIRIDQEILISLPDPVENLPMRLQFEGKDINRALAFQVEIRNTGSTPIGEVGKKWRLDLHNMDGLTVVPISNLHLSPNNLQAQLLQTSSPEILTLEIELLNPGDAIQFELMLIDPPSDYSNLPVIGETRISGLSQPVSTRLNVRERIQESILIPVFFVVLILMIGFLGYERIWPAKNLYKLTDKDILTSLPEDGVPAEVITKINGLVNKGYSKKEKFLKAVSDHLTKDEMDSYNDKLLRRAYIGGNIGCLFLLGIWASLIVAIGISWVLAWIAFLSLSK